MRIELDSTIMEAILCYLSIAINKFIDGLIKAEDSHSYLKSFRIQYLFICIVKLQKYRVAKYKDCKTKKMSSLNISLKDSSRYSSPIKACDLKQRMNDENNGVGFFYGHHDSGNNILWLR